jgi:NAD(P)H dehydrogenase (quinone)
MRALIVYCHPRPDSFTAAVRDVVAKKLTEAGAEIRLADLYARGFDPVLSAGEFDTYPDTANNRATVVEDVADIEWCDTLIFVYPTWWYGLPAMLKGWLDRVLVPGSAFVMPDDQTSDIRPGLTHITRLGVFTTCGASWWLTRFVGAPGRRTILRGLGILCAHDRKTAFAAHYSMDGASPTSLAKHLDRVAAKMDRFIGPVTARKEVQP